jgi:hypothetical protein
MRFEFVDAEEALYPVRLLAWLLRGSQQRDYGKDTTRAVLGTQPPRVRDCTAEGLDGDWRLGARTVAPEYRPA